MTRLPLVLCALAFAACDLPTAPESLNPYDPAFNGRRTATAPSDLRTTGSSMTEITLAWTDNSTFETGVLVERRALEPGYHSEFETVAVLPAGTTTYTDTSVASDALHRYRVTALAAGETHSVPSEELALRFPTARIPIEALGPQQYYGARIAPDGSVVFVASAVDVVAVDLRTGRVRARFTGAEWVAGFLDDGRVVLYDVLPGGAVRLGFYRDLTLDVSVTLGGAGCLVDQEFRRVIVSADGSRAIASCAGEDAIGSWRVASPGSPERVIPLQGQYPLRVIGLAPDGQVAVVGGSPAVGLDLTSGSVQWSTSVWHLDDALLSADGRTLVASVDGSAIGSIDALSGAVRARRYGVRPGTVSADGQTVGYWYNSNGPGFQAARASDLSPTFRFTQTADYFRRADFALTPTGAIDVSSEFPQVIRVWDASRSWEAVPSPL
jgi:hypothetical protein